MYIVIISRLKTFLKIIRLESCQNLHKRPLTLLIYFKKVVNEHHITNGHRIQSNLYDICQLFYLIDQYLLSRYKRIYKYKLVILNTYKPIRIFFPWLKFHSSPRICMGDFEKLWINLFLTCPDNSRVCSLVQMFG